MGFESSLKSNLPIVNFMKASRALILDPAAGSRTTIRKLLSVMGVVTANVESLDTMDEAIEKIDILQPNIIISEMDVNGRNGIELLALQRKQFPSTLETIFILLSSKNSPLITSMAAETDADGLIVKPLNFSVLESKLVEIASSKATPSYYLKAIEDARTFVAEKKYDEAATILVDAVRKDPKPSLAYYYLGIVYQARGELDEACESFEQGLKITPNHYRSMVGLFDLYFLRKEITKAYDMGLEITKHHIIPPSRIPDFVRISIQNHKYEDIIALYDVVISLDNPDDIIVTYVGAALVLCGKMHLKRNEKDKALDIFHKAQIFSKSKEKIQVEIISTLFNSGLDKEADLFLMRMSDQVRYSVDMRVAEMERMAVLGQSKEAIIIGTTLLKMEAKSVRLYEILIQESKKLKRPLSTLNDVVAKASHLHPESKGRFEELVKGYS